MADVLIYTKPACPYCDRAKGLLKRKSVSFTEINIAVDDKLREEMIARSGGRKTVPQIFINGQAIGGCDDLYALEAEGRLNALLSQ